MIEEGFLFRCVIRDVAITSLRVIRVAWVVPAYRWTGVGIRCGVGAWSLNPTLWNIMVAECVNDRVISSFCILRITVSSLHCWYARGNTQLFTITLMQNLVLVRNIYNR